jgi:hypothetical protein
VTGSSTVAPAMGKNALTSTASGAPAGYGPTTPRAESTATGRRSSTACALSSSTATQPGPLSTHRASRIAARSMPRPRAMRTCSSSSTGSSRSSGGAANASRSPVRRSVISPAPHSCTTVSPACCGLPESQAWHVPIVGWPANGSSSDGVKMRTR